MIKSIYLRNFFIFKEQKIDFGYTNYLVGINGAGKSNLIKAFRLLKATLTEGHLEDLIINKWGGFDAVYFKGIEDEESPSFTIVYEFDHEVLAGYGYKFQEPVYYKFQIKKVAGTQNYTIREKFGNKAGWKDGYQYFYAFNGKGMAREGERTDQQHTVSYHLDTLSDSMFSQLKDSDRYPNDS